MSNIELYKGDCLEVMGELIERQVKVDAIITDPPYGTIKNLPIDGFKNVNTSWDSVLDFSLLNKKFNLLLREKGILILFAQEPLTSKLITSADNNIPFLYRLIWEKDHFANGLIAKKAPVNYYEDICVFIKKYDTDNSNPLRKYFALVLNYINKSPTQIDKILGHSKANHTFRIKSTQFKLCSENTYKELIRVFNINLMKHFKSYEELYQWNSKYLPTFNLNGCKTYPNILKYKKDYQNLHPTQKPVALMESLIKTYTNVGETVLDFTMGSGTTGVACVNTERNFIGIELDDKYFKIAEERINKAKDLPIQGELF